ncbi:hypothetical protein ACA097_17770 [Pseudomonas sp. QL9]|uniref:hypothetical protein n=1 Tax=Pseudomonas sp. QL9 TaxID=3242725 RepID=UPI00352A711F
MRHGKGNRRISLPLKRVNGQWEFLYGGDVPLRDGAIADLVVDIDSIQDRDFRELISQELSVKVLPLGAPLLVALSDRAHALQQAELAEMPNIPLQYWPPGCSRFVTVHIGPKSKRQSDLFAEDEGGLWLYQVGLDRCELECSPIQMPEGFPQKVAQSPNHAVTMLSEQYESHRLSHTGNAYTQCFYQEIDGKWLPLSVLRDGVFKRAERSLIDQAWRQLEEKLGWCHLPPVQKKSVPKQANRESGDE